MLSVVIPTIGRRTINGAIDSVLAEGFKCIVINDGCQMSVPTARPGLSYFQLGRNWGRLGDQLWYGQIAFTTGVYHSATEFTMGIGDDDELIPGSGDIIRHKLQEAPEFDMWVPGLVHKNGQHLCMEHYFEKGNVSHVIYRSSIFADCPMIHRHGDQNVHDWNHVKLCHSMGYSINWVGKPCVALRPLLPGFNGKGVVE